MKRAAIVVIALLLGLTALPVVGAANQISNEPTCRDVNAGDAVPDPGEQCFSGSTLRRAMVVGLLAVSAVAAVAAMLIGTATALRNSRGILFLLSATLAIGLFFGAYGAARF